MEDFLSAVAAKEGSASAKAVRSVLMAVFGRAVRYEPIERNVIKLAAPVPKHKPSDAGMRDVDLSPRAVQVLTGRRPVAADRLAPVFPSAVGGWRDPSNTNKQIRRLLDDVDLARVTPHTFRRTFSRGSGISASRCDRSPTWPATRTLR